MTEYKEYSKSREIARVNLNIGGIGINPTRPVKWVSGFFMPIYNDNRMLLGSFPHRMLVTNGFSEVIEKENIEFDYILGTTSAGIAPASSLATKYNKPLIILKDGQAYQLNNYFDSKSAICHGSTDVIASTIPWGIRDGVTIANKFQKPFMYVRPAKKDHGKERQIEGILRPGQKVELINIYSGEENNYGNNAVDAILQEGGITSCVTPVNLNIVKPLDIKGKKVLVIEDLISYGGSSAKEVETARNLGAVADHLISIFTYNFDEAKENFNKLTPKCNAHSILPYEILLEEAIKTGFLSKDNEALLIDWRKDPKNWEIKYGFKKI